MAPIEILFFAILRATVMTLRSVIRLQASLPDHDQANTYYIIIIVALRLNRCEQVAPAPRRPSPLQRVRGRPSSSA